MQWFLQQVMDFFAVGTASTTSRKIPEQVPFQQTLYPKLLLRTSQQLFPVIVFAK
jgi:hypothetical protein